MSLEIASKPYYPLLQHFGVLSITNSGANLCEEFIIAKAMDEGALANSRVAKKHHFEDTTRRRTNSCTHLKSEIAKMIFLKENVYKRGVL